MESPRMGRTKHFAEVIFDTDHRPGEIVEARITGTTQTQLMA